MNFTLAVLQMKAILSYQWSDGFLPQLIFGSQVDKRMKWSSSNATYLPGPAVWSLNHSTGGIAATPLHTETALRIFRLVPMDIMIGMPLYKPQAISFLCDVYPSLVEWHNYLRRERSHVNETLISIFVRFDSSVSQSF